jgi:hypothetical protein
MGVTVDRFVVLSSRVLRYACRASSSSADTHCLDVVDALVTRKVGGDIHQGPPVALRRRGFGTGIWLGFHGNGS